MSKKKTIELESLLKHASEQTLQQYIEQLDEVTFHSYFTMLMTEKNLSKSDVIINTNLDRTYAYQILQGKRQGSKDKIVQFALGLHSTVAECNRLLQLSNNGTLYARQKRDAILIYALEMKLNVFQTNELLIEFSEDVLQ